LRLRWVRLRMCGWRKMILAPPLAFLEGKWARG
jgi:hypothetical protein